MIELMVHKKHYLTS